MKIQIYLLVIRNLKVFTKKLPYDYIVTEAMIYEKNAIEYSKSDFSNIIIDMWNKTKRRLNV